MAQKTLNLTIWERLTLAQLLPNKVPLQQLSQYLRLEDALSLSPEESQEVGLVTETGAARWDPDYQETRYEIVLDEADLEALIREAKKVKEWPRARQTEALIRQLQDVGNCALGL